MQKIAFSQILREEIIRASVFAVAFFVLVTSGFVGVAYAAADGGIIGTLLNLILVKNWDDPTNDGTVKNANNLGGNPASAYVTLNSNPALRSCGASQCIFGFNADGSVKCH